jgi:hypothetical protein
MRVHPAPTFVGGDDTASSAARRQGRGRRTFGSASRAAPKAKTRTPGRAKRDRG